MAVNGRRALALIREQREWTQEEVGRRMGGVHRSVISRYETGDRQLDLPTLDELLTALEVTPTQYCRLIDVLEEAEEQLAAYPTAQQARLPFAELGESEAGGAPAADRVGTLGDPELDAAARNLMAAVHLLLRSHYRSQAASVRREGTTKRPARERTP